jgi:pimeloyl-ACP methyl ester carboxylesterase
MDIDWQVRETGPADAERTVLLLPGGACSAGSYAEVMAEPALAGTRLVAVTLPGQAGAPAAGIYRIEDLATQVAELAAQVGADVMVGFSNGANVIIEMVLTGGFAGPVVLLGSSLSVEDEPAIFRVIVRSTSVLGNLPMRVLVAGAASMVKRIPASAERLAELRADFRRNDPRDNRLGLREYLRWLERGEGRAERLCAAGVPMWIMHAEKGDGGLTADERRTLEACPQAHLVTIPGSVFFVPNEVPDRVAAVIVEALAATEDSQGRSPDH